MSSGPEIEDFGFNVASLAHALARAVGRQRARGHRRLPALAPPAPQARAMPGAAPPPQAPPPNREVRPVVPSVAPSVTPSVTPSGAAPAAPAAVPEAPDTPKRPIESGEPSPRPIPDFKKSTTPKRPDLAARGVLPDGDAGPLEGLHPRVAASNIHSLESLESAVADCKACVLCKTRTQTVFMDGPRTGRSTSRILFIGEAPGADEDQAGTPFAGPAGALLTDIITKGMGLSRTEVSIANVLKCYPPGNRDPLPAETELCTGWLDRQIGLIDPLVIVPLGRQAACHILGQSAPLGRLRGRVHEVNGRKVVPTFHPAYLLRAPQEKKKAWEDIQLAMAEAGIPLPERG